MNEKKSKYFYKYRPLYSYWEKKIDKKTGEEVQIKVSKPVFNINSLNLLTKGELYFSSPSEFNDPFECEFPIKLKITKNELQAFLNSNNQNLFSNLEGLKSVIEEKFDNNIDRYINYLNQNSNEIKKLLYNKRDLITICCLSKKFDNILMWSHYGNNHNGICIGFKFKYPQDQYSLLNSIENNNTKNAYVIKKIKYQFKKLTKKNRCNLTFDYAMKSHYHKAFFWNYEKEYRIINLNQKKIIKLFPAFFKEIIFGLNVPEEIIKKTLQEINDSDFLDLKNLEIYKMKNIEGFYKLKRKQLDYKKYVINNILIKTICFQDKEQNCNVCSRHKTIYPSHITYKIGDFIKFNDVNNKIVKIYEVFSCNYHNGNFEKEKSYTKNYFKCDLENIKEPYYFYVTK